MYTTQNFGINGPDQETEFNQLGAELRAMLDSIDSTLAGFDYNGADPNLVLARTAALEAAIGAVLGTGVPLTIASPAALTALSPADGARVRCLSNGIEYERRGDKWAYRHRQRFTIHHTAAIAINAALSATWTYPGGLTFLEPPQIYCYGSPQGTTVINSIREPGVTSAVYVIRNVSPGALPVVAWEIPFDIEGWVQA